MSDSAPIAMILAIIGPFIATEGDEMGSELHPALESGITARTVCNWVTYGCSAVVQ